MERRAADLAERGVFILFVVSIYFVQTRALSHSELCSGAPDLLDGDAFRRLSEAIKIIEEASLPSAGRVHASGEFIWAAFFNLLCPTVLIGLFFVFWFVPFRGRQVHAQKGHALCDSVYRRIISVSVLINWNVRRILLAREK